MEVILIVITLLAIGIITNLTPLHKQLSKRPIFGLIIFTLLNGLVIWHWQGVWQLYAIMALLGILMIEYLALTLLHNKKMRVTVKFNRKIFIIAAYVTLLTVGIFPVFTKVDGRTNHEGIGIWKMIIESADRKETMASVEGVKRRFVVNLYYPISGGGAKKDWLEGGGASVKGIALSYGLPEMLISHLKSVKTDARISRKIVPPDTAYPVILISHGVKSSADQFSELAQSLADLGYFVVVVNHPYTAYTAYFDKGDYILGAKSPSAQLDYVDQKIELERQITLVQQSDLMETLKVLDQINMGKYDERFKNILDLSDITLVGHQVGGGAALVTLNQVPYIKTGILLNPVVEQLPKKYILSGSKKPIIALVTKDYTASNNSIYLKRYLEGSEDSLIYESKVGKDLDMLDISKVTNLFVFKGLSEGISAKNSLIKAQVELIDQAVQKYSQGKIFEDISKNVNEEQFKLQRLVPEEIDSK